MSILSKYSNKGVKELEQEIQAISQMYKKYNISKMAGYPWNINAYVFVVAGETQLIRISNVKNIESFENEGYNQLEGDW